MATHSEVAHAWANQTGKQRRGCNLSYDGPNLVSYRTTVARIVAPGVALFSENTYSVSTRQHLSYAHRAWSGIAYTVKHVGPEHSVDSWHTRNLTDYAERVAALMGKASRARVNRPYLLSQAESLVTEAESYRARFLPEEPAFTGPDDAQAILVRERARIYAAREAAELARREREAARLAEQAEDRAAWMRGEDAAYADLVGGPYLRLRPSDPAIMETSWGASCPLRAAQHIASMACTARQTATAWHPLGSMIRAGDFRLNGIDSDGTIHVGCHHIPYAETERFSAAIGFALVPLFPVNSAA